MQYGISNLSIVPMRSGASDKAEMVNQILFGEHFKVLENQKKFSRIRLAHDDYEGWICNKQWIAIEKENYNKLQKETPTLTTDNPYSNYRYSRYYQTPTISTNCDGQHSAKL